MKQEMIRLYNAHIRQKRMVFGPYFLRLYQGELTGIIAEASIEKKILLDFFFGCNVLEDGFFYFKEQKIEGGFQNHLIKDQFKNNVSVVYGPSKLFDNLSTIDNIFIPHFLIKKKRHKKIVDQLKEYFEMDLPLTQKISDLSFFQRIQAEILRAVALQHKLIFVADVNGRLHKAELEKLNRIYRKLLQRGYSLCLMESLNNIQINHLDRVYVVERGKTVAEYGKGEADYYEIAGAVNAGLQENQYQEMLESQSRRKAQDKERGFFTIRTGRNDGHISMDRTFRKGEIIEILCASKDDFAKLKHELLSPAPDSTIVFSREGKEKSCPLKTLLKKWKAGSVDMADTDHMVFENLPLLENLCYPLSLKLRGFYLSKRYKRAVGQYAERLLPDIPMDVEIRALSPEQLQRVAICKWMICRPDILFIFIPSTFIKAEADLLFDHLLLQLSLRGVSVFLIAEKYKVESEVIDEQAVFYKGKNIANGHFPRPAGPHFPASQGHIKRPVLEIGRADRVPPC